MVEIVDHNWWLGKGTANRIVVCDIRNSKIGGKLLQLMVKQFPVKAISLLVNAVI